MNERRKKVILSEIEYWKRNQLLPSHYCDFLSTLYTGGEEESEVTIKNTSILAKEKRRKNSLIGLLIGVSLVIAVVVYLMNDFSAILLGTAGIILLLGYTMLKSAKKNNLLSISYVASAFLLLIMSLKLWSLYFDGQPMILVGLLILNCIMWLFAGRFLKLLYFTLSGSFGLVAIIFFIFYQF